MPSENGERKIKWKFISTVDVGDAGWKGNVGLVTGILKDVSIDLNNAVVDCLRAADNDEVCDPEMLEINFKPADIYLSMEKNMSCGLGNCGHCRVGLIMPVRTARFLLTSSEKICTISGLVRCLLRTYLTAHRAIEQ